MIVESGYTKQPVRKYLVFVFPWDRDKTNPRESYGGWEDFKGSADTLDEARELANRKLKNLHPRLGIWQIVNTETGMLAEMFPPPG